MDRNEILEKNLFEAGRLLKESKKMITLTYSERTYLQQWFYQKTGNRISSRKCDLEEALYVFYEENRPQYVIENPDSELKTEIIGIEVKQSTDDSLENSEVSEKQTTAKKPTAPKKSTTNKNSKK